MMRAPPLSLRDAIRNRNPNAHPHRNSHAVGAVCMGRAVDADAFEFLKFRINGESRSLRGGINIWFWDNRFDSIIEGMTPPDVRPIRKGGT